MHIPSYKPKAILITSYITTETHISFSSQSLSQQHVSQKQYQLQQARQYANFHNNDVITLAKVLQQLSSHKKINKKKPISTKKNCHEK